MRRRLLLTTDAVGGVWSYSIDLARALSQAEDMVVILAVLGPEPTPDQLTEAAAVPGLQLIATGLPLDWTAADEGDVRHSAGALASLASEAEADMVQLHSPALALCPYPAPLVSVVHSCVATWWQAVRGGPLPADLAWRAALVREGMERSDLVVAPTRAFAGALQAAYDLSAVPHFVHNGRSSAVGAEGPIENSVLTAGRLWDAGKNVAAFDRAAALSRWPWRAAGPLSGPFGEQAVLRHARALGRLTADAVAGAMERRPVFVSTALYEPFGLAVLEAAQAGCALVLADRPGFRELWEGAALFVDPLDEQEISEAVDRLMAAPASRLALGAAARERSAAFTPEAMARGLLTLADPLAPALQRAAA
jgi:glycosyltransferase involved in cell wall biosynthesis